MTAQIRVSHVAGLIEVEHVQPGWLIRRRGQWCEIVRLERCIDGAFSWAVYVREYTRPLQFASHTSVQIMAPVEGTKSPSFMPSVPAVEPYPGDKRDGKLYLTQDQAALLVNLFRTYFPADFENYETGRYVKSLTAVLTSFAEGKR